MLNDLINKWPRLVSCVLSLFFCFVLGSGAVAAEENGRVETMTPVGDDTSQRLVSVDFNDVDLTLFIKFISDLTNKNFVIDQGVREKVTIISPSKITVEEAYQVFESVLEVYGYTTVESGQIIKIVKAVDARTKSIATGLLDESGRPEDRVVTQIIPLQYADTEETKQLLTPLISKTGVALSFPSTNMLIVTDVHSNIMRLQKIIDAVDITGTGRQVTLLPLKFADAVKVVSVLENVFQTPPARRRQPVDDGVQLVADERINAVLVLASEIETGQVEQLIELLDREVPRGKERIHVYYLKNADAEDLSRVLLNLPREGAKAEGAARTPVISRNVSITADSATNSLIIMAERDDYAVLTEVIEKLDIPRPMVYIEALIVEVNLDSEFGLGTEWMFMDKASYKGRDGGYGTGFSGSGERGYQNIFGLVAPGQTGMGSLPPGFSVGAFGEAITIGNVTFPNLAAIIRTYQRDKDVRILSTPQIMTTNNTEASIIVGRNIPYLTRVGTTSAAEVYSNYEYKDVGISLRIRPQINENRLIRLDLTQEVTRLDLLGTVAAERPSTLKRAIETNVIVHDGHTVVIGGLIDDSMSHVAYSVPCLGRIPLLGWFFRGVSDASEKTNLFVFLTPHVVKTRDEAAGVVDEKKEVLERMRGDTIQLFPGPKKKRPEVDPEADPEADSPEPELDPELDPEADPEADPETFPVPTDEIFPDHDDSAGKTGPGTDTDNDAVVEHKDHTDDDFTIEEDRSEGTVIIRE